jgi:eukaryotic-like serine/threonine-protein kinase
VSQAASPEFLQLQQTLAGRFSLERELGRGGMGVVYLARDVALDRLVAIKVLPAEMAANPDLRERFLREARTAAQLSHPNIVPIHLVEERDGLVCFVMAFVDGESLGDQVRRSGPLAPSQAVRLVQEIAWALGYAHGRGVIHRDVKPDNILLERHSGRALLADFGIARSQTASAFTTPGLILGSLQYMAPEQTDANATIDGRADLYALGVTAFYAVTGRLPFQGEMPQSLIAAHLLETPPPVSSIAPSCPPALATAIDRCLAKDPAARWATGEGLADTLRDVREVARPMPPSIRALVTAAGSGLLQTGVLGLIILMLRTMQSVGMVEGDFVVLYYIIGSMAFIPLLGIFSGARAVVMSGFTANDIVDAVAGELRNSDRYTEIVQAEVGRMGPQLRTWWGRLALGAYGVIAFVSAAGFFFDKPRPDTWKMVAGAPLFALVVWIGVECMGHALQLGPFKHRLSRFFEQRPQRSQYLIRRIWGSAPVRWMLKLASFTVRKKMMPTAVPSRPTEMVLASAAAEIFAALPASDRAALAGVPEVMRELEMMAASLRARQVVLDQAMASVGDADSDPRRAAAIQDMRLERERVTQKLRSSVEAIENLRLDLLRLRAGVGSTADLTEAIEQARALGREIDYTIAGRIEAARLHTPV